MSTLKMSALILMTSLFAYAKGPMLHGTFQEAGGNTIAFVTVDLQGTATRVSKCNVSALCAQSRTDVASCTNSLEEKCPYLQDIMLSKLKFDSQNGAYPWIVEYSFQDANEHWTPLFTVRSSTTGDEKILVTLAGETTERAFKALNPTPRNPGVMP